LPWGLSHARTLSLLGSGHIYLLAIGQLISLNAQGI
jgi:hypothetical protein